MPKLEFRIHQACYYNGEAYSWFNRFVFDSFWGADAPDTYTLAFYLMNAVRASTLEYVQIIECAIFEWAHKVEKKSDGTPFVINGDIKYQTTARPVTNPCPPYVALQLNKQAAGKKSGRIWLFHSLNEDEVKRGDAGQLILTSVSEWEAVVAMHWRYILEQQSLFQLLISPKDVYTTDPLAYAPCRVFLAHPVQARARQKKREMIYPQLAALLKIQQDTVAIANITRKHLADYTDTYEDYVPANFGDNMLEFVGFVHGVGQAIKEYDDKIQAKDDSQTPWPLNRWGSSWGDFVLWVKLTLQDLQDDFTTIHQIKPYTGIGGEKYLTQANLVIFQDIYDKYANWLANYSTFDYLTPYYIFADTSGEPPSGEQD